MKPKAIRWLCVLLAAVLLTAMSTTAALANGSGLDDVSGALIVAVISGSPASEARLARGDVVLAVGDEAITSSADLREQVQNASPGDVLALTVQHGDEEYIVDVELGDQDDRAFLGLYLARDVEETASVEAEATPSPEQEAQAEEAPAAEAQAEVAPAEEVPAEETQAEERAIEQPEAEEPAPTAPEVYGMMPFTYTAGGALIIAVSEASPAEAAGLNMGDVILGVEGERMTRASDLADRIDEYAPGDQVTLEVLRRTGTLEDVVVTLGEHPDDAGKSFLGIQYLPTPRRMFLGHSEEGDLLVPPGPYFHGPRQWWPRAYPRHHWMPFGNPFDGEGHMPWCDCDEDLSEDDGKGMEAPDESDNAYSPLLGVA